MLFDYVNMLTRNEDFKEGGGVLSYIERLQHSVFLY